jgi:restriction endonuclease Mrr
MPYSPLAVEVGTRFSALLNSGQMNQRDLLLLSALDFEKFVAYLFEQLGWEVELTARTRDGGRDVIAVRKSEIGLRMLIECKRYDPSRKIGVELVRSLLGVTVDERATKGILATTSTFTNDARGFLDRHIWQLEGRDYAGILDWVNRVRSKARGSSGN